VLDNSEDTDQVAILNKLISITPLHYDLTDYRMVEEMKQWNVQDLKIP